MSEYQFSVEATLQFGSGLLSPPPRLMKSHDFMAAVHVLTFRVMSERLNHFQVERVISFSKLGPQEIRIKEAWERVQKVGAKAMSDDVT